MAVFVLVLLFTCTFMSCFQCSENSFGQDYKLVITSAKATVGPSLFYRKGDTLNITCRISSISNATTPRFKITVHPPYNPQNSMNRVTREELKNALNIVVSNLQESDGGDYKCQAVGDDEQQTQLQGSVYVNVKTKKCGGNFFQCSIGLCIMRRYVCDGHPDCRGGEDESVEECGQDPCKSKLYCEDKRCIPIDWCCDSSQNPNCTVRNVHKCCQQLNKPSFMDHDAGYMNEHQSQGLSDMGFLQTTIYTVVGCAMAFMFIVTILAIAICRVHMKRSSLLTRCPGARGGGIMMTPYAGNRASHHHHHGLQHVPLYDLDVLLNRPPYPPSSVPSHSGLLVTYNINNGVQFVGRPIDPPPYCEIVASPPREGPPPPYASHENLTRTAPEASCAAQDDVEGEDPGEGDSLLGPSRGTEQARQIGVRREYVDILSPSLLATGNNHQPVEEMERNHQVGGAVSVILNNDVYDRNPVSSLDTICSFGTDDRVGELIVESGLSVNSCENLVVAPKLPDAHNLALSSVKVIDKPSGNTSHVDSSSAANKITHGEGSFSVACENQDNPLQCLHDTFVTVHTSSNDPGMIDTATSMVGTKPINTCSNVSLANGARTHVEGLED